MLVANFFDTLQAGTSLDQATMAVLRNLFHLFSFYTMDAEAREFQTSGAVGTDILDKLPGKILSLMEDIRPHAVRLVDSFALPDYLLDRWAKQYYHERLLTFAVQWVDMMDVCMRISSVVLTPSTLSTKSLSIPTTAAMRL